MRSKVSGWRVSKALGVGEGVRSAVRLQLDLGRQIARGRPLGRNPSVAAVGWKIKNEVDGFLECRLADLVGTLDNDDARGRELDLS